ncbi:MAG TPA: hypothetical protein VKE69_02370, partial [Planctomycetota bacterium]|nr:hypothetical protein [Planctomycetota bacterium]
MSPSPPRRFVSTSLFACLFAFLFAANALADHGPGTSGGGASTQSAETLKPGKGALDVRFDWTEFENLSRAQIDAKAARAGNFDFLDRSFVTTASGSIGIVEDFQGSLTWGYY